QARRAFFSNTISLRGVVFPPPKLVTETGGLSGVFFTMLRYSFALRSRSGLQRQQQQQRQQRQQTQKDHLITGCQEGGRTRGPRQQTSRPSSFLRQGSQRPIPRSFFSTFAADTATATAMANALVATVPLLLLLSLSNALFGPIFSAAFFSLSSSFSSSSSSSSFPSYGPTPPLRPFQGRGIQQFLDQFEEKVPEQSQRVDWLPFFVLTEDLPWPAAKTALLRYYGAFDQIRTVGFYEKLRRHEARRPKTKDTIDWLEKHAFFCRKVGPGPDESTEHSYGLFQALPKEIQVQLYDKLERPSSSPYGILFSTAYFLTQIQLEDDSFSGLST
ncbi:hypothetical protein L249_6204, partial [Ophiocordyceps polyrhachis-furcata BCC 54312]